MNSDEKICLNCIHYRAVSLRCYFLSDNYRIPLGYKDTFESRTCENVQIRTLSNFDFVSLKPIM